jgi:hypothetical protein
VLVVVFQEDIRRVFEQLGSFRREREEESLETSVIDHLVRTIERLAASRTGALFVIPGREPLDRHLEGGVLLNGRISEPLLLSLFDPSSPGHDGAIVLRNSRVERFAVHLPLSANHTALGPGGTRHAAALGLSERCDAVSIAVSEERGTVSVARNGALEVLASPADLTDVLQAKSSLGAVEESSQRRRFVLDGAIALVAAFGLWMVLIPDSDPTEITLSVPVKISNLPDDLAIESIKPETLKVTLEGTRRDLKLADDFEMAVEIDAYLARLGRRTFVTSVENVRKPDELNVLKVGPEKVRLSLRRKTETEIEGD